MQSDLERTLRGRVTSLRITRTNEHDAKLMEQAADLIAKLPVTADGVVVVPGMDVFMRCANGSIAGFANLSVTTRGEYGGEYLPFPFNTKCYSTQAAAEATREASDE